MTMETYKSTIKPDNVLRFRWVSRAMDAMQVLRSKGAVEFSDKETQAMGGWKCRYRDEVYYISIR